MTEFNQAQKALLPSQQVKLKVRKAMLSGILMRLVFLNDQAPNTVNPTLWRQAKLNNNVGLFKVTDRVWQIRGFDLANMTIIQGDTGWIIVDTLTSKES